MKCISVFLLSAALASASDYLTAQAARAVIGQATFTDQSATVSASVLGAPGGVAYANDTLIVADSNRAGATPSSHRVLIYRNISSMLPSPTASIGGSGKCPLCTASATVVLGQPDFVTNDENTSVTASTLRQPTGVATDGVHVVVADTNHNRVLIWNSIPTYNNQPADVVVGQTSFTTSTGLSTPSASTLLGPQGVWIQNSMLFVADTGNDRVLIWKRIPTANGTAADIVVGQPDFQSRAQQVVVSPDSVDDQKVPIDAKSLLTPSSATSDGTRLVVSDLGHHRVLIWDTIPTSNYQAANVEIGQPSFTTHTANYAVDYDTDANYLQTPVLCTDPEGIDSYDNLYYDSVCSRTLSFPRFALINGGELFISDGGNDRILVYKSIPTTQAAAADYVIGQEKFTSQTEGSGSDQLRVPMALASDGLNLFVADPYNRRVAVYTMGEDRVPYGGVVNGASLSISATAYVQIIGTIHADEYVRIKLGDGKYTDNDVTYKHKVLSTDTLNDVIDAMVYAINAHADGAGDPNAYALADYSGSRVLLLARDAGTDGNKVTLSAWVDAVATNNATEKKNYRGLTASASGTNLTGGGDATVLAPGAIATINGNYLAYTSEAADLTQDTLPTRLANTEVYINGIRAPLFYVSPTQINVQIPWEVSDTTSISVYVRTERLEDGTIFYSAARGATIAAANPGIFAQSIGSALPRAVAFHASSYAKGIISVDGGPSVGDKITVAINDREYYYVTAGDDTLYSIRSALISLLSKDPEITVEPSVEYTRIILTAKIQGPEGNNIRVTVTVVGNVSVLSFSSTLTGASVAGALVTPENPADAGEFIYVYATGLGLPVWTSDNQSLLVTGKKYPSDGPEVTLQSSVSASLGGKTADVLSATIVPGQVGLYKVMLHINQGVATSTMSPMTLAQGSYISKVVTIPVLSRAD
jgi:hypothetical protein